MKIHRPITPGFVLLFVFALVAGPSAGRGAAAAATTFSGQATVISGQVAGIPVKLVDTGPVAAGGGQLHESLLEYPISGVPDVTGGALTADILHATVVAQGNKSSAEAVVADFTLNAANQKIGAEFLAARASATCNSGAATITESSEIVGLTVNGQQIAVGTQPQTITLPVGSIVINEQPVASASGDSGSVTVNALHIMLTDPVFFTKTDLIVASAHADIACATQTVAGTCLNQDFVTGGGWITTKTGSRATFAVAGGPNGFGHFEYIDHGSGLKVHGTAVTFYGPGTNGPTSREIDGTAQWTGGGSGAYAVDVADNGEPGHDLDVFQITAPAAESAKLGGGNIQLHCK